MKAVCRECGFEDHYLGSHVLCAHGSSLDEYQRKYPDGQVLSEQAFNRYAEHAAEVPHRLPVQATPGSPVFTSIAGVRVQVNTDVLVEDCLPLPNNYRLPQYGKTSEKLFHVALSLHNRRHTYIWGQPGAGKDAFVHAWSWLTRTPALILQIRPGEDLQSWLYTRSFDKSGTRWDEGALLKAVRDGYTTTSGRKIPYLVLITDFDRATPEQGEILRLILDSISGRIQGPEGQIFDVLPGTLIVATGNTAGGGDPRGRNISANPIDASLFDRFKRKFEFGYLDRRDEEPVVKAKFPLLVQRSPWVFNEAMQSTESIRTAIENETIYWDFGHRTLCDWLEHAEDYVRCLADEKEVPDNLLRLALCAIVDGGPDPETRDAIRASLRIHLGGTDPAILGTTTP